MFETYYGFFGILRGIVIVHKRNELKITCFLSYHKNSLDSIDAVAAILFKLGSKIIICIIFLNEATESQNDLYNWFAYIFIKIFTFSKNR